MEMRQDHEQRPVLVMIATFLNAARLRLWRVLHGQFDFAELQTGLLAVAFGAWLLHPDWDTFDASPSFRGMAALAPEWIWGAAMLAMGLVQITGLAFDLMPLRKWGALVAVAAWTFLAVLFGISNIEDGVGVVYTIIALSAGWARLRMDDWPESRGEVES